MIYPEELLEALRHFRAVKALSTIVINASHLCSPGIAEIRKGLGLVMCGLMLGHKDVKLSEFKKIDVLCKIYSSTRKKPVYWERGYTSK